jgi:hypothetical protein
MRVLLAGMLVGGLLGCERPPGPESYLDASARGAGSACSRDEQCQAPYRCISYTCAHTPDASRPDAAVAPDAGRARPDASRPDVGTAPDAAPADAATAPDAAPADAATAPDAALADAATAPDAHSSTGDDAGPADAADAAGG